MRPLTPEIPKRPSDRRAKPLTLALAWRKASLASNGEAARRPSLWTRPTPVGPSAATDNGGAFLTTDGGTSWTHLDGLRPTELLDVAICPTNGNIVLATAVEDSGIDGDNSGGIWRSTDGGTTWQRPTGHAPTDFGGNPLIYTAFEVAFEPGTGCSNVFVGTSLGLASSTNAGAAFNYLTINGNALPVVSVVPSGPNLLDIHAEDGHYRSVDAGANWTPTNPGQGPIVGGVAPQGLPNAFASVQRFATHSLAISPFNNNILYGATLLVQPGTDDSGNPVLDPPDGGGFEVYESLDGGTTWTAMTLPPTGRNRVPFIFAVPSNGSSTNYDLFASDGVNMHRRACVEPAGGSTGSPCAGSSWVLIDLNSRTGTYDSMGMIVDCATGTTPCTHNDPSDLAFNPTDGCPMYLASDSGIQVPLPPGGGNVPAGVQCGATGTWVTVGADNGFDALEIYEVAGQGFPGAPALYIGMQDNDIWASVDGGANWPNNRRAEGLGLQVVSDGTPTNTIVTGFACAGCSNFQGDVDFSTLQTWGNPDNAPADFPGCDDQRSNEWLPTLTPDNICDPLPGTPYYSLAPVAAGVVSGTSTPIFLQWIGGGLSSATSNPNRRYQLYVSTDFGNNWAAVAGATIPPAGFPLADPTDATRSYHILQAAPMVAGSDAAGNLTVYQGVRTPCLDNNSDGVCEGSNTRELVAIQMTNTAGTATPTATTAMANAGFGSFDYYGIQFKSNKFAAAVDPASPQRIIAADFFAVPATGVPGMRQTTDGGATWSGGATVDAAMAELTRLITAGGRFQFSYDNYSDSNNSQVSALQFDPDNSQRILVGTEQTGIISSLDGGASWARVCGSENIPRVTSFFFDNVNDQVYASSYGRGLWTVDPAERQIPLFTTQPPPSVTVLSCGAVDVGMAAAEDHCENTSIGDVVITSSLDPASASACTAEVATNVACGDFDRGDTPLTWTATDGWGNRTTIDTVVTVDDQTPPELTLPPDLQITQCNVEELINVGEATAIDDCLGVVPTTGAVISTNGVDLDPEVPVVGGAVALGFGTHVIRWTATDGITSSEDFQTVTIGTAIQADGSYSIEDGAEIRDQLGNPIATLNSGEGQTHVGVFGVSGEIIAGGNVDLAPNAQVSGDILAAGSVSIDPAANYGGTTTQGGTINLPAMPMLPAFPPPAGSNFGINPGETVALDPGSYAEVYVNSNPQTPAVLQLGSGDYYFSALYLNSDSILQTQPDTRIFVSGVFVLSARVTFEGGAPLNLALAGTGSVVLESSFTGTLIAPERSVAFGTGSGTVFSGAFYVGSIVLRPNSELICIPTIETIPTDGECDDGILNGTETDIDCGGDACGGCDDGDDCEDASDCVTGLCTAGTCGGGGSTCDDGIQNGDETGIDCGGSCPPCTPPVTLVAEVREPPTHDWGYGYCVTIDVTNTGGEAVTGWTVTLNTNASTIYDDWNGIISGPSGEITIVPEYDWNQTIPAGETNSSIGFCANRDDSSSGLLPFAVGAE